MKEIFIRLIIINAIALAFAFRNPPAPEPTGYYNVPYNSELDPVMRADFKVL